MTIEEASVRYNIPVAILQEYEGWGLCDVVKSVMGAWRCDDRDLERLSMIMTLHDIGFTIDEVERYMRLWMEGSSSDVGRLRMLDMKRISTLDEIHFRQIQLDRLDYLRHEIRKAGASSASEEKQ